MEPLLQFGLDASHWLQATFPQLEAFFQFISTLGIEEFYLALFPLIYWSVHKEAGRALAYVFLVGNVVNNTLKHAFREPRPFWLEPSLEKFDDGGYGLPSGHTQFTTTIYLFAATWIRRRWMWLLAGLMIILMGISRIYLGSHFVHDVALGFVIGLLVLGVYLVWQRRYQSRFEKRIFGQRLMVAVLVPAGFTAVYLIIRLIIGEPNDGCLGQPYSCGGVGKRGGVVTAVSSLLGAGIGLVLERSRIRFLVEGPIWQRAVRYVLGMVVAVAIWAGLGAVFPDDPLWLALPLRLLRYALLTLWVTYYAPWVFVKIKIAQAKPDPGIEMTL
ncbi:MAG: phosphatase PAP2 family protein [Chloroflexota bacterium]